MQYRKLGNSDVKVSEISLGCWTMGGLNWVDGKANGWANPDEDAITAAIKNAVDAGVNHFDNADVYGNGNAERMLARVFKRLGLKSEDYIIASKMGHFKGTAEHPFEPMHIRRQCEQSLINLKRDYIDLYYFHHANFGEHLEEAAATMDALVAEGKVRLKGQSGYDYDSLARAIPVVQPSVLQSWANAMDTRFIEPDSVTGKLMAEKNITFVAFSPLAQGLLLDKFDPENPPQFEEGDHRKGNGKFSSEQLRALKPKMQKLKEHFGERTEDLAAMALRYILNYPQVSAVIPGFRNEKQVACNLAGANRPLSYEEMQMIQTVLKDEDEA